MSRSNVYEGSVYFERFLNGAWGSKLGPIEATQFAIKSNTKAIEQESRGRGTFGQIIAAVNVPAPSEISVTFTEGTAAVMAMGLAGTVSVLASTGGTLTAVDVVTIPNAWATLTKAALTGLAAVTNAGATVTYVEGTDYLLNRTLGLLKALSTGAIVAAATVKLTSSYAAISGSRIDALVTSDVRLRMTLDGRNLADGSDCVVTVHEAVLAASAVVDFLSGAFINVPLTGRLVTPVGKTSPVQVDMRDPA